MIGDPFFPFCGSRKGGAEGCEGNRWDVAEGELDDLAGETSCCWEDDELSCRRDACRLGDQTRTVGKTRDSSNLR